MKYRVILLIISVKAVGSHGARGALSLLLADRGRETNCVRVVPVEAGSPRGH